MGKAWEHLSCDVDVGWTWGRRRGVPNYKLVHNKSESEFLIVLEYS